MLDLDYTDKIREIFSAACRPPPLPSPDASMPSSPWILLEPMAYVADVTNDTTAEASSSTGDTIQVTVCHTDPLGVSHVCVHYPGYKEADFASRPTVVSSEKNLLILKVSLLSGPSGVFTGGGLSEYFVYKAGPGRPSLRLIPGPYPRVLSSSEVGLVPHGDGSHFVLAVMCFTMTSWVYDLHLFSSMTWAWSTKAPHSDVSSAVASKVHIPIASKVIQLGGGTLGWVDLWNGILVCNVLDEMPIVRFIVLPMLMPGNKEGTKASPWPLRDVACSNGLIKFIELENHERPDHNERSYDDMDVLYESDCLKKPKVGGWRVMTWHRMTSWNHWRKGCMAYDNEILVDYPSHSMLLPVLRDDEARVLTLKDMIASYPVLSLNCDSEDVVYFLCKSKSCRPKEWLITVDLRKKTLIELAPFSLKRYFRPAKPSVLSSYLNIVPGTVPVAATEGTSEGV